jgi:hypothetical protein
MNVLAGRDAERGGGRLMTQGGEPGMSAKVADLQQRIALGKYCIPAELVAEKLMAGMLEREAGLITGRLRAAK